MPDTPNLGWTYPSVGDCDWGLVLNTLFVDADCDVFDMIIGKDLAQPTSDDDGMAVIWDQATGDFIYGATVGGGTTVDLAAKRWEPTNDASGFASAQAQVKQSSASVPSPRWIEWLFDATTDEFIICSFQVPSNYSSAPILKIRYKMASATSGAVGWGVRVMCVTPDDAADMDAETFATSNTGSETVPGTAGYPGEISITLTNADSMAAGDMCILLLYRDADQSEVTDDATGDAEFVGAVLSYTGA
jgi:hypothetical protein